MRPGYCVPLLRAARGVEMGNYEMISLIPRGGPCLISPLINTASAATLFLNPPDACLGSSEGEHPMGLTSSVLTLLCSGECHFDFTSDRVGDSIPRKL